jgi:2-polyprenyl-3-methyl-5-hydroxy-6-metoxy-1,4-benzoquinol methylase
VGVIGGALGFRVLRAISLHEPTYIGGSSYARRSKVETLLGKQIWDEVRGKVVVDFGCGPGVEAIELAQRGARRIYGIDILERWLVIAREQAAKAACLCRWCTHIRNDGAQKANLCWQLPDR